MAIWYAVVVDNLPGAVAFGELLPDAAWIFYLFRTTRAKATDESVRTTIFYFSAGLACLLIFVASIAVYLGIGREVGVVTRNVLIYFMLLMWMFEITFLFYIGYLFRISASSSGSGFRVIVLALGVMRAYNLNLFTMFILGYPQATWLLGRQGALALVLVPIFAVGSRRKETWRITLSRQATTQSLMVVVIGAYLVVMASATRAALWAGWSPRGILQILLSIALSITILVVAMMPRLRARLKIVLIKNLFEHRYDYRTEWLRFSSTISDRGTSSLSGDERAIRSLADITESQRGLLLMKARDDLLVLQGTWQQEATILPSQQLTVDPQWLDNLALSSRIIDLDDIRAAAVPSTEDGSVPEWLVTEESFWIAVPLVKSAHLIGLIVLGRPLVDRALDWEDFDLLKVIAQQIAVHLIDERRQAELEEARRFEEFNRRFAFIIHDLKNVVSQLALLSANAEEHGDNPKFQVAMAKTLKGATAKMSTLLSRLSTGKMLAEPNLEIMDPRLILDRLVEAFRADNLIVMSPPETVLIRADGEQLFEALGHLVTNAIEASPAGAGLELSLDVSDSTVVISLQDYGRGMSSEFMRNELFKPFSSTKTNGFGIGAAEARALIQAMGGELSVSSVVGEGTRFSATFPACRTTESDRITSQ